MVDIHYRRDYKKVIGCRGGDAEMWGGKILNSVLGMLSLRCFGVIQTDS